MSQRTLHQRGILPIASSNGWQSYTHKGQAGWAYPVKHFRTGETIATRWKAASPTSGMKYAWLPNKPSEPAADWYILPQTQAAIAAAQGIVYLANGEPALLAYHAAGIHNVIATTLSEVGLPSTLISTLQALEVSSLRYPVDNDSAGEKSAIRWRDALRGTGIDFEAFTWGESAPAKADANDIWIASGFNPIDFQQVLAHLPSLTLPLPVSLPKLPERDFEQTPDGLLDAIASRLNIQHWKNTGWSAKNISSPFREDSHPSAAFNRNSGVLYDFGTGESYSPTQVAEALGIDWKNFYSVTSVTVRTRKDSVTSVTVANENTPDSVTPVTVSTFIPDKTLHLQYISEMPLEALGTSNLIRSPLATGKTALLAKLIRQTPYAAKILVITHLQALAENISERLSAELERPVECYNHIPNEYRPSCHRLVCSYDSLHTIGDNWDYVFIDEHEQFHRHLGSGTMKGGEPVRAFAKLIAILTTAKHVTVLDAHMSKASQDWLTQLRGETTSIQNSYRHKWSHLTIQSYESGLLMNAFAAAEGKTKGVVIPTNSRSKSRDYYDLACERFGKDAVMLINGENSSSKEAAQFIRQLTDAHNKGKALSEIFPNLRILITSPSLATGIDVQAEVAGVYGVFTVQPWVNAFNILQMMMRYRRAETRQLVLLGHGNASSEDSSHYLSRANGTSHAADFQRYKIDAAPSLQSAILALQSAFDAETRLHQSDLDIYLQAAAKEEGFEICFAEQRDTGLGERLKLIRRERAKREKTATLNAEAISPLAFELLQQDPEITSDKLQEARFGLLRWKVEFTAGQAITEDLYERLHTSRKRADFKRFVDILDSPESLKKRDRDEASFGVLLIKRKHFIRNRDLIVMAGESVFGKNWLYNRDELSAETIGERLEVFLRLHYEEIQIYLDQRCDLSSDPICILRRLFKRVGLKLERRQIMQEGRRFYVYCIDATERTTLIRYGRRSLEARQWRELLQSRKDSLDKQEWSNPYPSDDAYLAWQAQAKAIPI